MLSKKGYELAHSLFKEDPRLFLIFSKAAFSPEETFSDFATRTKIAETTVRRLHKELLTRGLLALDGRPVSFLVGEEPLPPQSFVPPAAAPPQFTRQEGAIRVDADRKALAGKIVDHYLSTVKPGGNRIEAMRSVYKLLGAGEWTESRLLTCINNYRGSLEDLKWAKKVEDFFSPDAGVWIGFERFGQMVVGTLPPEVAEMREARLRLKKEAIG
jgi:hypothetical protein